MKKKKQGLRVAPWAVLARDALCDGVQGPPPAAVFIKNFDSRGLRPACQSRCTSARCSCWMDTLRKAHKHLHLQASGATGRWDWM